jgi:hypothetical protein
MHGLEMVGQTIISASEIKSLVFDACPEIPFTRDEEAMGVTNVIIERAAVPKVAVDVVEIAFERVVHLIIEQIKVVLRRWCWRRLDLVGRCACKHGRGGAKEKNRPTFSDIFHGVVKAFVQWTNRMSKRIPVYRRENILARSILEMFAPAGF